jgi:hypothetical protein
MAIVYNFLIRQMQLLFILMYTFLLTTSLHAQKAIRLTRYHREVILSIEQRVKYQLNDGTVNVGRLEAVADDFIVVNDREIRLDELRKIGRKGSGSNFFGIFLASLGSMMSFSGFIQAVDPYDECISCPGGYIRQDGKELLLTMSMTGAGFLILNANKTRNLDFWQIEVIERPDR